MMANSIDGDGRVVGGWGVRIVTRLQCVMILVWSSLTLGEMHSLVAERRNRINCCSHHRSV